MVVVVIMRTIRNRDYDDGSDEERMILMMNITTMGMRIKMKRRTRMGKLKVVFITNIVRRRYEA